jgi:hypothetical protein
MPILSLRLSCIWQRISTVSPLAADLTHGWYDEQDIWRRKCSASASRAVQGRFPVGTTRTGGFQFWTFRVLERRFGNFGERDSSKLDLDYTLVGVSGGIYYRFSERLVTDFGVGYGRNRTDNGDNATESRANAYRAAVYGSFKPFDNFFVDALTSGSIQHFDSTRFIKTDGSFTDGKRNGVQLFGSLMAAHEFRRKTWPVSPYSRLEMSCSSLDG